MNAAGGDDAAHPAAMTLDHRRRAAKFRAWHRGTREADFIVGGFADRYLDALDDAGLAWFEALLDEQDVDVMAWALGTGTAPARYEGPHLDALKRLDFVRKAAR